MKLEKIIGAAMVIWQFLFLVGFVVGSSNSFCKCDKFRFRI